MSPEDKVGDVEFLWRDFNAKKWEINIKDKVRDVCVTDCSGYGFWLLETQQF